MKLRITLPRAVMAVVAAVIAMLALSTCDDRWLPVVVELQLLDVKIGGRPVTLIPSPIPGQNWNDEDYNIGGTEVGIFVVKEPSPAPALIAASSTPGAMIHWGVAKAGIRPVRFNDMRMPAPFEFDDFIYIRVTDDKETKYYRFYPLEASPVKELAGITIAGREPTLMGSSPNTFIIPTPAIDIETLSQNIKDENSIFYGQIDITRTEALGAIVEAAPQDGRSKIRYATAPRINQATTVSEWSDTISYTKLDESSKEITVKGGTLAFTDGCILYVEVTAEDDKNQFYYGFQVTAGRMTTIAKLEFDGKMVPGKGTGHGTWSIVSPGSYSSADQTPEGFAISIVLDDPEAQYDYTRINSLSVTSPPSASSFGHLPKIYFGHRQVLVIRVQSQRGSSGDTKYFKVEVNLLAANFKRQPQPAVYHVESHNLPLTTVNYTYKGDPYSQERVLIDADSSSIVLDRTIEPLTIELDRGSPGDYTYQWYEANSWYGGYGFDRDGRILGDPGFGEGLSTTDRSKYGSGLDLDEKTNVSLHNGGNQYYRLESPGRIIPGQTGPSYTPTITARQRPFLPNFSYQTHYYWVEVTDAAGLKAISKRAIILTDWREEWNLGAPTGNNQMEDDEYKAHYVFNLNAYLTPGTPGFGGNPRNELPFTKGNHGDQYLIPLSFPAGFNIKNYTVVTCQALFYLADGTPWIQNWTQGDFGFADAAGEKIVLWYNLTADNATRALGSSGNEPAGGGIDVTPAYLVVQPAGTKPTRNRPPFESDGVTPTNTGDAQGWFTPFIEICELRFEGPSRP